MVSSPHGKWGLYGPIWAYHNILYILYLGEVYPLSSSSPPVAGTGGTCNVPRGHGIEQRQWITAQLGASPGQKWPMAGSRPEIKCGIKNMEKIQVPPGFYQDSTTKYDPDLKPVMFLTWQDECLSLDFAVTWVGHMLCSFSASLAALSGGYRNLKSKRAFHLAGKMCSPRMGHRMPILSLERGLRCLEGLTVI